MILLFGFSFFSGFSIEVYIISAVIAFATYFFWQWLFKKLIRRTRARRMATWLSTVLFTPIVYIGFITLIMWTFSYEPPKKFDKWQWLSNVGIRYQMANDIIASQMLMGKDTNQVLLILGQASKHDSASQKWIYDMGAGSSGLKSMFHHLHIRFDNSRVISVEHTKVIF